MRFIAIDFETANPNMASICQIGTAIFSDDQPPVVTTAYVNPEDYFAPWHTAIHGIAERHIQNAAKFPHLYRGLRDLLAGQIVVCHTRFDRVAFQRVCQKYRLASVECRWLDSVRVARRAWTHFAGLGGYGMDNLAYHLGIEFRHHDAGEDARAAGEVLLRAIEVTGVSLEDWFRRVEQRISAPQRTQPLEPNPDGPLAGEVIAFTGTLSVPRPRAQQLAADAGCQVESGVTRRTTLLVVGDQDISVLVGHTKSSKHRKAEDYIAKGQPIRIIGETDFSSLVGLQ